MNRTSTLPMVALLLAATPAMAQTYMLDKIVINGLKSADPAEIAGQLKFQKGTRVSTDDILADQDQLTKLLEAKNITGGVTTSLADKHNGHVDVIFDIKDQGVQAPKVVTVAPKLKGQIFTGNDKISSDDLMAASGLTPGEEMSNDKILAAQKGIAAAYQKSKAGVNVTVTGSIQQSGDGVQITWAIVETKVKKKKKADDDGGMTLDQAN